MAHLDDAAFYRMREKQELHASEKASDPMIKRLHWEMTQRYAQLAEEASEAEGAIRPAQDAIFAAS